MNDFVVFGLIIWTLFNIIYSIILIKKDLKSQLNSTKFLIASLFLIALSPVFTYIILIIAKFFKKFQVIDAIGTADAWISFAGSIVGGSITMFALYVTLKHESKIREKNYIDSIKPYVSCHIVNYKADKREIDIDECVNDFGHIQCIMKNISNNIGNIKLKDQFSGLKSEDNHFTKADIWEQFGISIYTVQVDDGFLLAPQESYKWDINFKLESNEDGKYKFKDGSSFWYTILYEITDVSCIDTYTFRFDFEFCINIDNDDKPIIFLDRQNNSIEK